MKSRFHTAICVAVTVLVIGLSGCAKPAPPSGAAAGGGGSTTGAKVVVVEQDFEFTPADVKVKVGDVVEFSNKDSAPHRVSINGQDLGQQAPGTSVSWQAKKAGSFPFTCTIHPAMTGQVTVQ